MGRVFFKRPQVLAQGGAVQLNGKTGEVEAEVKGGERIFSRPDTKRIVTLVKAGDDAALGRFVFQAIKRQDGREPEYTEE